MKGKTADNSFFLRKLRLILLLAAFVFLLQFMYFTVIPRYKAALREQSKLKPPLGTCADFVPHNDHDKAQMDSYIDNLDFNQLKEYVMFFGMGRTGHSWIGTILDASPNALVANEFDALEYFYNHRSVTQEQLFGKLARNSYLCGMYGRVQVYNYTIPGLWQGRVENDKLQVIGDKKGRSSIENLRKMGGFPWLNPNDAQGQKVLFDTFFERVKLDPKLIVVLRNPFNMISTYTLRHRLPKWISALFDIWPMEKNKPKVKDSDLRDLTIAIKNAMWAKDNLGKRHQWHVMTMESFGSNTEYELEKLCNFTRIDCPEKFTDKVIEQTHHESHDTYHLVSWRKDQIEEVNKLIRDFLPGYYTPHDI